MNERSTANKLLACDTPMVAPRQPLGYQLEETNAVLIEALQMVREIRSVMFGETENAKNQEPSANVPCIESMCDRIDDKARDVRSELFNILSRIRG